MSDDPVGTLIGAVLIGLGAMVLFGSVRNRKVFGKDGMLASALTTGSLLPKTDRAYNAPASGDTEVTAVAPKVIAAARAHAAIVRIGQEDPGFARLLETEFNKVNEHSTRDNMFTLSNLLDVAERRGFEIQVEDIRDYVYGVTGERI